uniref:AT2G35370 protein n=1 Tax=Arabidopsis thaliana TaxID=3702 RepID=C0Z2K7_ARATH|nr:AT2G35370 [Arabidopsis thaliana]BAH57097.1 AT2G35370 [Arabidopsis thaliana]
MALRMWASSTANALKLSSSVSKSHLSPFSFSRCFSTGVCNCVCSCVCIALSETVDECLCYFFSFGGFEVCKFT